MALAHHESSSPGQPPIDRRTLLRRSGIAAAIALGTALFGPRIAGLFRTDPASPAGQKMEKPEGAPRVIRVEDVGTIDDVLDVLRRGDIIVMGRILEGVKYLHIHRETDGNVALAVGHCFPNTPEPGHLYVFADAQVQQAFQDHMNGSSSTQIAMRFGPEMELLRILKVKDPSERLSLSFRVSVDDLLLKAIERDQFIIPVVELREPLGKLANGPLPRGQNSAVQVSGYTPNGKRYGQIFTVRCIGQYDPKTNKKRSK